MKEATQATASKNAPQSPARKPFVAPKLERLGALTELTKAFVGAGTDSLIPGNSKN